VSSLVLAAAELQLKDSDQAHIARRCARTHRKAMARLAEQPQLEVWNRRIDIEAYLQDVGHQPFRRHLLSVSERARHRDSRQAVAKLCQADGAGVLQIRHDPPLIWRHAEMQPKPGERPLQELVHQIYASQLLGRRCGGGGYALLDRFVAGPPPRRCVGAAEQTGGGLCV